jgi:3-keto-disaccharide hydrolase
VVSEHQDQASLTAFSIAVLFLLFLAVGCADKAIVMPLSPTEQAEGWRLLFDGRTLSGWRGYRSPSTPENWKVVDGTLFRAQGGGDIMTVDQFGDFELRLEWRISKNGNSGIMFRVTGEGDEPWWTGPEMQVLDNGGHPDGKDPLTSAGSNYALHAPVSDVTRPVGEWNDVRIVVKDAHVEHWLNGVKVVEYELWSPDWESRVRSTKFASNPQYGRARSGHIVLQDHGDAVWYRNIRIKPL